jgi:tetratricopeptide (TPR) repeat protein
MKIRKEQALLIGAVLLGAWIWSGNRPPSAVYRIAPRKLAFEAPPPCPVVLAEPLTAPRVPARDVFREPSESASLPPRHLAFPPLAPLPLVMPPLSPGQHAGAFASLRLADPTPVPHRFAASAAVEPGEQEPTVPTDPGLELTDAELARRFDQVITQAQPKPFFGHVRADDPYALARTRVFTGDVLFEQVSRKTGQVISTRTLKADEIKEIRLADNLRNWIELRKRDLPAGLAAVPDRIQFVQRLLDEARREPWVYEEALAQGFAIREATGGGEEGWRWIVRVLRASGDLAGELALYRTMPPDMVESAFRYRNQGQLEARLTLWDDAEAHLRKAVDLGANDARSLAALAAFLLERGRAGEALAFAERAGRNNAQVNDPDEKFEVLRAHIAALLAVGRLADAAAVSARLGVANGSAERAGLSAAKSYVQGAVAYAAGDLARAEAAFRDAGAEAAGIGSLDPLLGIGLCQLRAGSFDEARQTLEAVRASAPLLRHRAATALAVLYERTGNGEEAVAVAADAVLADPKDAYGLYVLGRQQRLAGQLDAAVATLLSALAERDDLTDALAEITMALYQRSQLFAEDAADSLARASRYADRLVRQNGAQPGAPGYVELQAYVHYLLGDMAEARRALLSGVELGSEFCQVGLAIMDYRQKRTTEARDQLARIGSDAERSEATRSFARQTLDLIDDHAGKEQVRDAFDRSDVGGLWENPSGLKPSIVNGELVFSGRNRSGGDAFARRTLSQAGNLLRVETAFRLLAGDTSAFVGVRVARDNKQGSTQQFLIELGAVRGSSGLPTPQLRIVDGADGADNLPAPLTELGAVDFGRLQRLAIEVVPVAGSSTNLGLVVYWNDQPVKTVDNLKGLRRQLTGPLHTDLLVRSGTGANVEAAFDDYRLVRRKEK